MELPQSSEIDVIKRRGGTKRRMESTNKEAYKQHRGGAESEERKVKGEEY